MKKKPVHLIVEGGGDDEELKRECRKAFRKLLESEGFRDRLPSIIAAGSRWAARDKFELYVQDGTTTPVLLIDSEGPVQEQSPWEHVRKREGADWQRPKGASDEQLQLMAQCMEAWFLADVDALAEFYGEGFNRNALPRSPPEGVDKQKLFKALDNATRRAKTKGKYGKAAHSFKILATLDPSKIRQTTRWGKRFFVTMTQLLG